MRIMSDAREAAWGVVQAAISDSGDRLSFTDTLPGLGTGTKKLDASITHHERIGPWTALVAGLDACVDEDERCGWGHP